MLIPVSVVGTAESSCWQSVRFAPVLLRVGDEHCAEISANAPLVRTSPPSDPKMAIFDPGTSNMAWLSGCIPLGAIGFAWQHDPGGGGFVVASHVMSVKETPAFAERMNARPLVA